MGVRRALPRPRRLHGRSTWWWTRPPGRRRTGRPALLPARRGRGTGRGARSTSGSCGPPRPTTPGPAPTASSPNATSSRCAWPCPLPAEVVAATRPLATRAFVPGRDEEAWVDMNNRAFAGHPEQGGWTVEEFRERMAADWVDLDGFLVADDPDGAGPDRGVLDQGPPRPHAGPRRDLRHRVDPRQHGKGWVAPSPWPDWYLAGPASRVGMLYTDADNEAAVALYRSLGFTVDHVDRSYGATPRSA